MVRIVALFLLLFSLVSFAEELNHKEILLTKIKMLIDDRVYQSNKEFINIIFSPESNYFHSGRADVVKIVQTLKDNGLLNIFFKTPQEITIRFKTSGTPLFFVKIMGDTLRNMGYYRYVTKESHLNEAEFLWTIGLTSEYVIDPLILQRELEKSGCKIDDIIRTSPKEWEYMIDMREGRLDALVLRYLDVLELKRSLYDYWIDVSEIEKIEIESSNRNSWYPYISYYNKSLHLLKVVKEERQRKTITLEIPKCTKYIKISDTYTIKNIRDGLVLIPVSSR
ncbi:MAG: hypothetical protein RBR59_01545 [Sulfurimonadaceae bacterium]|jgi:hypothetical protein|nr:hypothetical protein [Sulfurimonadaceae bacterium]